MRNLAKPRLSQFTPGVESTVDIFGLQKGFNGRYGVYLEGRKEQGDRYWVGTVRTCTGPQSASLVGHVPRCGLGVEHLVSLDNPGEVQQLTSLP